MWHAASNKFGEGSGSGSGSVKAMRFRGVLPAQSQTGMSHRLALAGTDVASEAPLADQNRKGLLVDDSCMQINFIGP